MIVKIISLLRLLILYIPISYKYRSSIVYIIPSYIVYKEALFYNFVYEILTVFHHSPSKLGFIFTVLR